MSLLGPLETPVLSAHRLALRVAELAYPVAPGTGSGMAAPASQPDGPGSNAGSTTV